VCPHTVVPDSTVTPPRNEILLNWEQESPLPSGGLIVDNWKLLVNQGNLSSYTMDAIDETTVTEQVPNSFDGPRHQ
jgi:hypothetical protein